MNENRNKDMNTFMDEIADALGKTPKNNPVRHTRTPSYLKSTRKAVILGAIGACIVIVVIVFFSRGGDEHSVGNLSTIQADWTNLREGSLNLSQCRKDSLIWNSGKKGFRRILHTMIESEVH